MSAHPRPPAVSTGADPSETVPAPPADATAAAPSAPLELLRRYRAGTAVGALAKELGVSFEWVARRVIAAGTRRDRPQRAPRRPAELDSDEWLGDQLAGGAGVRDLSRRLDVTPSTVRKALRDYAARQSGGSTFDAGASDPERRFAAAADRAEQAAGALERARQLQASAVSELQRSGLTIAAIAERLHADEQLVENLLTASPPPRRP
jgi:hypothetical protein